MITDFFSTPYELREFAPQMPTDGKIETLEAHFRPQYQKIINLIGLDTYQQLKAHFAGNKNDMDSILGKSVSHLRGALANLTAIPYFNFEASQRNNTENRLYRYQEDKQLETYLENAWTELNFLLDHLENNLETFDKYANTDQYKLRQGLFIKNASQFKRYYGSVNSAYFFNNVIYIIEEVQNDEIKSRLETFPDIADDGLKYLVGKAIVYEVLSRACLQLDYTELPLSLRNDLIKEVNEKNGKETDVKNSLAANFALKAKDYFIKIEDAANTIRNAGFVPSESILTQDDKFYMP